MIQLLIFIIILVFLKATFNFTIVILKAAFNFTIVFLKVTIFPLVEVRLFDQGFPSALLCRYNWWKMKLIQTSMLKKCFLKSNSFLFAGFAFLNTFVRLILGIFAQNY